MGISCDPLNITSWVSQGSPLGHLLFLIFSNDKVLSIKPKLSLYADDSIILVCDKSPNAVYKPLAIELENCNNC